MRFGCIAVLTIALNCACEAQEISKLGLINSIRDEQAPILAPDGKRLYFTVTNHAQNVGGPNDHGDIWFSQLTEAGWSAPIHGGRLINNGLHNTVAGFSADGTKMYLMGHYAEAGKQVQSQGISVTTWTSDWGRPKNLLIPYFKNRSPYESGSVSADGKVLVFSADSYGTLGAEDIYVSVLDGRSGWSEPKNLGNSINTSLQDVSPSLSADGKRLFFASNGRNGNGSFDLFYTDRLDDTWQRWSEPVNMGTPFNTEGRELFYRTSTWGDFYTSTQNSDGYSDIKFYPAKGDAPVLVASSQQEQLADTVSKIAEVVYEKKEIEDVKSIRLWGRVTDLKTGSPIAARLHFFNALKASFETNSSALGEFEENLLGLEEYTLTIEAAGYIGLLEKLDLSTQVLRDVELNFRLQPVEVGATVNLKSVLFQQSTATLLTESYDELDMVAEFMNINPKVEIELAGHTDNRGYHQLNMKLSRERVEAVKKYLVSKGIDAKRIAGKGYGGTKPIADNDAEETRALNRRVEFTIVKD